ncbi:Membrane protein involved in the export of O-antigen and teichoic acid [Modicisalibacter ilicicola DSM 19980]|uniref:Membrane protein involved in the export of O-antigen and teichoic acid n=1 Tax=Modicisalibacter ilicicola DSM 19980 TaxID=1121942 RepID=A0A1M5EPS5_9GAMM|nr:oligosaccharide flippase family protein [Halomonas ilicicola]SHF81032.1 Membrane protein involved in the export of O-antigen and teichoic acid [Halomonas ilicicola DSM 19980]
MSEKKEGGFFTGAFVYLLSNVINASIPFLLLPILTRQLEPAEYGQVAMFQTLIAALMAFVGLNTDGAANRKYYDSVGRKELSKYLGVCLQVLLLSSFFVFFVFFLFKEWFSDGLGISPLWIMMAVLASASAFVVRLRLGQWQVRKKPIQYGLLQNTMSFINAAVSIILVVFLTVGPEGAMAGQLIAPLLMSLLSLFLLRKDGLLEISLNKKYVKDALGFGVPLVPHVGGVFLLTAVDRFFINKHLGLESAGIYMVAVQLTMAMGIFFNAFNKAYVPWLYERLKKDDEAQKRQIVKWTYGYFVLAALMALVASIIGPYVVVWFAGEKYAEAGSIIGLLAVGQAFQGMYLMVTNYLFYSKRTGRLSMTTIGSGLLNILLMLSLIPIFGIAGAAVSFALSMSIRFLLTWWVSQKSYPMPWFSLA